MPPFNSLWIKLLIWLIDSSLLSLNLKIDKMKGLSLNGSTWWPFSKLSLSHMIVLKPILTSCINKTAKTEEQPQKTEKIKILSTQMTLVSFSKMLNFFPRCFHKTTTKFHPWKKSSTADPNIKMVKIRDIKRLHVF